MLKKNLLIKFIALTITGTIATKESAAVNEYASYANEPKTSYKELFIDNKEDISNIDISDDKQNDANQSKDSVTIKTSNYATKSEEKINSNSKVNSSIKTYNVPEKEKVNTNLTSEIENSLSSQIDDKKENTNLLPKVVESNEEQSTTNTIEQNITTDVIPIISAPTIYYERTTSIYADDRETLLRVEYYANNKLVYYSDVEHFDATTKSYTEKIYQWNYEKDIEVLIRTDIYSNGVLINSY